MRWSGSIGKGAGRRERRSGEAYEMWRILADCCLAEPLAKQSIERWFAAAGTVYIMQDGRAERGGACGRGLRGRREEGRPGH